MQTDVEKAVTRLRFAHQTCSAVLQALADPKNCVEPEVSTRENSNGVSKPREIGTGETLSSTLSSEPSLDLKLTDFSGLLTLLYQNVTKLALAAGPGITSDQFQAAILAPSKEIAEHIDALASCACSVDRDMDGRALVRELRWATEDVVHAFQALIEGYIERVERQSLKDDCEQQYDNTYLIKTGAVHDTIDRVRSSLSRDNRAAAFVRWIGIVGGLDDCMNEIQEIVEEEEVEEQEEGSGRAGSGTDSLDIRGGDDNCNHARGKELHTSKATKDEIWRMNQTLNLLKFMHALAKRISSRILEPTKAISAPPAVFDELLVHGDALLTASDNLVDALYIPQKVVVMFDQLASLRESITGVHVILSSLNLMAPPLADQDGDIIDTLSNLTRRVAALKLIEPPLELDRAKLTKEKRWLDVCISQIYKSVDTIQAKLNLGPELN